MAKSQIKLQYSGFIIFAARILSVATGLAFQLMIARQTAGLGLTKEYDMWYNINDIIAYFTLLAGMIPFWVMRFEARGEEDSVKTGVFTNLTISLIATLIYLPLVTFITSGLGISQKYVLLYYLVAVQIIEIYSINVFESCLRAKIPHVLGYGLVISELCKVVLGYIIIIQLQQPLVGAITSLTVGFALQTIYYSGLLSKEIRTQRIKWDYIWQWLKGSIINIWSGIGGQIAAFVFIMLFQFGGVGARSDYGVAAAMANIITYSSFLAFALYPKLLAEQKAEDVTTSLKTVLMFALPMAAGEIALADSYLIIMGDVYRAVVPVLVVLALDAIVSTVSTTFNFVAYGAEKLDEKAKVSFRQLFKSRLFIAFSLPWGHLAITVPTTVIVLTTFARNRPLEAAIYVSIINAIARLVMFLILFVVVRGMIKISIPWGKISKYVFASAVMGATLYILPHPTRIIFTAIMSLIGTLIYLTLLATIDKEAKALIIAIVQEIKNRISSIF